MDKVCKNCIFHGAFIEKDNDDLSGDACEVMSNDSYSVQEAPSFREV